MSELNRTAQFLRSLNVLDLTFSSGETLEVYVASTPAELQTGLAGISHLELDLGGMLFCFPGLTTTPFTAARMAMPMDIAWYGSRGNRLASQSVAAGHTERLVANDSFLYVVETPAGRLPEGDLVLNG